MPEILYNGDIAELIIKMRVLFKKGKQKKFLDKILSKISINEAARICGLSERTIRDWRREKFLPQDSVLRKLCRKTSILFPSNIELKDDYWYTAHGSSAGGLAVYKKYGRIGGDPEYRKKKWREWWEQKGRYQKHPLIGIVKPIKKPRFSSELAEFVGIVLGDGSITPKQVQISLNKYDDKEYVPFIKTLIKKLFNLKTGTYNDRKSDGVKLQVSSVELINYLLKLGLKIGNKIKQQIDVPDWIKQNKKYAVACMRGLIDTDGSIFTHRYKVNGKWYKYKKLCFTSYSEPLRESVFNILKENGLNPRLAQKRDVRLDSIKDMQTYFQLIGFRNPKHLKRYKK